MLEVLALMRPLLNKPAEEDVAKLPAKASIEEVVEEEEAQG